MNRHVTNTIVAAAFALSAGAAFAAFPDVPPTTDGTVQSQENFNYGVCTGTDPSCYHNWGVTRATSDQFPNGKVLLYTRTAGPRHASIGTALPAGLNPPLGANNQTQKDIIRLLNAEGIAVDYTETVTNLSNLNQYAAVIFFSNSRDALWDHGRAVNPTFAVSTTTSAYLDQAKVLLRQYMRAGGGFVAIHNGFGTEYNWPYYEGLLGNANYYDHGSSRTVLSGRRGRRVHGGHRRCRSADPIHGRVVQPRALSDQRKVSGHRRRVRWPRSARASGFPSFHPVAWCHYYDGGRAWLTTLGHDVRATHDMSLPTNQPGGATFFPGAAEFQSLIVNGIKSAMGLIPFCT